MKHTVCIIRYLWSPKELWRALKANNHLHQPMDATMTWTGGSTLQGETDTGVKVDMDWENGPSPMQLVLQCAGACSLIDVIEGLRNRVVNSAKVELTSERASEPPKVFTAINMHYIVDSDAPEKLIKRLIEKSHEKYCSVSNMLTGTATITWTLN